MIDEYIKEGKIVPVEVTVPRTQAPAPALALALAPTLALTLALTLTPTPNPHQVTVRLLHDAIKANGGQRFLVDGFPRNANNLAGK